MAIQKHIKLTGTSTVSWKDAIVKSVEEAAKTIKNITHITIIKKSASISENKISEYLVELDLTFTIDDSIRE